MTLTRGITADAGQRRADETAELKRRVARLESRAVAAPQRVQAYDADEVSTTSSTYVNLGGPEIEIDAPHDESVILLSYEVSMKAPGGVSHPARSIVKLNSWYDSYTASFCSTTGYSIIRPYVDNFTGTGTSTATAELLLPLRVSRFDGASQYIITFEHKTDGSQEVFFKDRRLWATVL